MRRLFGQPWLPVAVCGAAFLLRMAGLNSRPLWYDEAFAVLFAEKGVNAMLVGTLTQVQGAAADVHPIVYYSLLNGWMALAGQSALAVRMLSVFPGLLALAVVYRIARSLLGNMTALAGLVIAAALPFQVDYSQEARMYAGLALFCSLTVWFYLKASAPGGRWVHWVGLALSAAAAMYMQNLAAVFLVVFGLSTVPQPRQFAKVAAAGTGAFLLWLPWFLNLPGQVAKLRQAYWVTRPDFVTLLQTLLVYHAGEELLEARLALFLALFLSLALTVLLVFQLVKNRAALDAQRAAWLAVLAYGMPAMLFLVSLYQPVYIQRALLPAGLMYASVLGWLLAPPAPRGAVPGPVRFILAAALTILAGYGLVAHYTFAQFPRPDFPAADSFLKSVIEPGDVVIHSNKLSFFPMYYYDRGLPQAFVADAPGSGSDTLALPTQTVLGLYAQPDALTAAGSAGRVWLVVFDKEIQEYAPKPHPQLVLLASNFQAGPVRHFDDLGIYEFTANRP